MGHSTHARKKLARSSLGLGRPAQTFLGLLLLILLYIPTSYFRDPTPVPYLTTETKAIANLGQVRGLLKDKIGEVYVRLTHLEVGDNHLSRARPGQRPPAQAGLHSGQAVKQQRPDLIQALPLVNEKPNKQTLPQLAPAAPQAGPALF